MAYNKKTWLARLGQGLNKFIFNGGSKVTLDSAPDVVTQAGTPLSADNMNDLEQRIDDEFTNVNSAITSLNTRISTLLDVETKEVTIASVPANSVADGSVSVARTGYTAIGLVGWTQSYTGGFDISYAQLDIAYQTAYVRIRNFNPASYTNVGAIYVYVLYVKNAS